MKKSFFSYLFLSVILLMLGVLFKFSLNRNLAKSIGKVQIEFKQGKNDFLTHNSVDNLLIQNGKPVKGQLRSLVNLYRLEQDVLRNPYVEDASVYISCDGVLKADVKQREPIARVVLGKKSFYVDKFGICFPLSSNFSSRVPLISGVREIKELNEVVQIMNFLLQDKFLKKEVVAIEKNNDKYSLVVRSGDYRVVIGNSKGLEIKFKKLKAFYNKALKDKTLDLYKKINVNYHNQVVCTK